MHTVLTVVLMIILFASCSRTTATTQQTQTVNAAEIYYAYVIAMKSAQVLKENRSAKFYIDHTDRIIRDGYGITQDEIVSIIKLGSDNNLEAQCERVIFSPCMQGIALLITKAQQDNRDPTFEEIRSLAKSLVN